MRRSQQMIIKQSHNKGFTLIELLIAMLISGVVITAIYSAYQSNMKAHITQQRVVDMQQNIRAILFYMARDIQMAGYDPDNGKAGAGIINAESTTITFSMDTNENGTLDTGETITYDVDINNNLTRDNGTNTPVLGQNVNVLDFVYLDKDGAVLPDIDANGVVDEMSDIISIQISVLIQDGDSISQLAQNFTNNKIYNNQQGTVLADYSAIPDKFKRRLYSTEIKCRNFGL